MKSGEWVGVRNRGRLDPGFGNFYFYRRALLRPAISIQLNPPVDLISRSFRQLNPVIADEGLWRFDQDYITRDTAVIPPVRVQGRNRVVTALAARLDHEGVIPVVQQLRHLEIERRETAFVLTQCLAI